ncbi:hypothetical protein REJC140_02143 [Pseudorhizobium endolithicum]|uniref:Uncharacterized protein n=1 Tax=Pseudorhizobium endolithicum TaxID=1191678 RepID=A0ABN7JYJ8_9HYPH|nr:hypothetical protein REQ54_02608 [Rhizobium sp. Q54]CAD7054354.1 hypothetical protein REJC140_02143 [Pseudorhizobium endolithicum]
MVDLAAPLVRLSLLVSPRALFCGLDRGRPNLIVEMPHRIKSS